jgi:hypothetical protein
MEAAVEAEVGSGEEATEKRAVEVVVEVVVVVLLLLTLDLERHLGTEKERLTGASASKSSAPKRALDFEFVVVFIL